jgi:hypothetical protein
MVHFLMLKRASAITHLFKRDLNSGLKMGFVCT